MTQVDNLKHRMFRYYLIIKSPPTTQELTVSCSISFSSDGVLFHHCTTVMGPNIGKHERLTKSNQMNQIFISELMHLQIGLCQSVGTSRSVFFNTDQIKIDPNLILTYGTGSILMKLNIMPSFDWFLKEILCIASIFIKLNEACSSNKHWTTPVSMASCRLLVS